MSISEKGRGRRRVSMGILQMLGMLGMPPLENPRRGYPAEFRSLFVDWNGSFITGVPLMTRSFLGSRIRGNMWKRSIRGLVIKVYRQFRQRSYGGGGRKGQEPLGARQLAVSPSVTNDRVECHMRATNPKTNVLQVYARRPPMTIELRQITALRG